MKRIVSTLIPAVLAVPALAAPADDAAIRHVIEQHYNRPVAAEKCQLSDPPKDSQNLRNTAYCMKRAAGHTVTRNGKTTRYELYTGFAYDLEEKRINDAHASSGLAEVFVLEKEGGKWAIKLHGKDEVGAWGKTPDAEDWRFMQVGGQNWGYAVETAYTGQGSTVTGLFLLFSDNHNRIANSYIPTGLDNGAHYGNCKEYKGRERRHCEEMETSLDADVSFNRRLKPEFDVWAVEASLSGTQGKKRYRWQKYLMPYNGKTHVVPKGYPLYSLM